MPKYVPASVYPFLIFMCGFGCHFNFWWQKHMLWWLIEQQDHAARDFISPALYERYQRQHQTAGNTVLDILTDSLSSTMTVYNIVYRAVTSWMFILRLSFLEKKEIFTIQLEKSSKEGISQGLLVTNSLNATHDSQGWGCTGCFMLHCWHHMALENKCNELVNLALTQSGKLA